MSIVSRKEFNHYVGQATPLGLIIAVPLFISMARRGYMPLEAFASAALVFGVIVALFVWLRIRHASKVYLQDIIDYEFHDNTYENSLQHVCEEKNIPYHDQLNGLCVPLAEKKYRYLRGIVLPALLTFKHKIPYCYTDAFGITTFLVKQSPAIVFSIAQISEKPKEKVRSFRIKTLGRTEHIYNFEKISVKNNTAKTSSKHLLIRHVARDIKERFDFEVLKNFSVDVIFDDGFCKCEIVVKMGLLEKKPQELVDAVHALVKLNDVFIKEQMILFPPHAQAKQ